jgi:hypothetical protein
MLFKRGDIEPQRLKEVAEKRRQGRKSSPQALKRGHNFSDLAARLKSGPSQNLRETYFFRSG